MKTSALSILLFLSGVVNAQVLKQEFVSSDVTNFWQAYDSIVNTTDSVRQISFINDLYISKASQGLVDIINVRGYTAEDYVEAINKYPKFWTSARYNTIRSSEVYPEITEDIRKLQVIYPSLKPSTIYFTIGLFRTGGTTMENRVLIGSELSLADKSVDPSELPAWRQPFYQLYNPKKDIALLCTHEYIHTQQHPGVDNLLCNALREGVAEFVSCLATGKSSNTPSFEFGRNNEEKVKAKFIQDLFLSEKMYNWMWGENQNEFKERDLGYYIGYRICENYYNAAKDKQKAIKDLIEIDFSNEKNVEQIIDDSKFFSKSIKKINKEYEKSRPYITHIEQFKNGSKGVDPNITTITLHFSEPMNPGYRGFDYGPLGEDYVLGVQKVIGFSEDGKSFSYEIKLLPNKQYQTLVTNQFRNKNGIRLKPYLIELTTGDW